METNSFQEVLEATANEMGYSYIDSEDPEKLGREFLPLLGVC